MTKSEAERTVLLCENASDGPRSYAIDRVYPDKKALADKLRAQKPPQDRTLDQAIYCADLYVRAYDCFNGELIPEEAYLRAKRLLESREEEKRGGAVRGDLKEHLITALAMALEMHAEKEGERFYKGKGSSKTLNVKALHAAITQYAAQRKPSVEIVSLPRFYKHIMTFYKNLDG